MRPRSLAFLGLLAVALPTPPVAHASCAESPPIDEHLATADVVFVGTVIGLRNQNRTATFVVTEIWRGPDLLPEVFVRGGPDDPNTTSSIDRTFELGTEYLVAARVANGDLVDDACSATRPWHESLARHRPPDAKPPSGAGPTADEFDLPLAPIALAALFVVLAVVSGLAFRGRR